MRAMLEAKDPYRAVLRCRYNASAVKAHDHALDSAPMPGKYANQFTGGDIPQAHGAIGRTRREHVSAPAECHRRNPFWGLAIKDSRWLLILAHLPNANCAVAAAGCEEGAVWRERDAPHPVDWSAEDPDGPECLVP